MWKGGARETTRSLTSQISVIHLSSAASCLIGGCAHVHNIITPNEDFSQFTGKVSVNVFLRVAKL